MTIDALSWCYSSVRHPDGNFTCVVDVASVVHGVRRRRFRCPFLVDPTDTFTGTDGREDGTGVDVAQEE
jgi:hypothetical protein